MKARILIIYTGGTIGMAPKDADNPASPLMPAPLDELLRCAPRLKQIQSKIEIDYTVAFEPPLDSSDITPLHWVEVARIIKKQYDQYDGFVILHGTDTMAYTASGLAFILNNLSKPVIVTGSLLPIGGIRTDAVQNLVAAVYIAGYKAVGLPRIQEVILCFSDKILRGCRATKVSTVDYAGFDSPNFPPLGSIGQHIKINQKLIWKGPDPGQNFFINEELADEVMQNIEVLDIGLFPGFKASQLKTMLDLPNVKGVVLRTFGAGNAPKNEEFLNVIEEVISGADPCVVLNVTQCRKGKVEMGLYASSSELLERGVISGLDMTEEAALAKLYWTLGTQIGSGRTTQLQINQRGEQSENLFDLKYGPGGCEENPLEAFTIGVPPGGTLERSKLSRSVVRLSGVQCSNVEKGQVVRIRIFMNKPTANVRTPTDDPCCVAEFETEWLGNPLMLIQEITDKTKTCMGEGEITLTVLALDGVKIWFKGLYLAVFTEALF